MSLVSVILPTFNRPKMLNRALMSIDMQTFTDYEIIVINDAGEDVAHVVEKYPKAQYVSHRQNRGLAASRNTGLSVADGEYIAYLDDDDIWFPEHLEVCMEPLMILPNIRAVYTNCYRWINEKALFYQKDKQPEVGEKKHNVAAIINVVHEASVIDEIGAFDDDMRYLEDWDFLYRLSRMVGVLHIEQYTTCYSKRQDPNQLTTHDAEMKRADAIIKERYGREAPKRRMEAI